MGWKFWKATPSDAQESLAKLRTGVSTASVSASTSIPSPGGEPTELGADFTMVVEDAFSIEGRGTVVLGKIASGTVRVGATITITGAKGTKFVTVAGMERERRVVYKASTGDQVGLLLARMPHEDVAKGDVISG